MLLKTRKKEMKRSKVSSCKSNERALPNDSLPRVLNKAKEKERTKLQESACRASDHSTISSRWATQVYFTFSAEPKKIDEKVFEWFHSSNEYSFRFCCEETDAADDAADA